LKAENEEIKKAWIEAIKKKNANSSKKS